MYSSRSLTAGLLAAQQKPALLLYNIFDDFLLILFLFSVMPISNH